MKLTKDEASAELEVLADQTHALQKFKRKGEEHIRWIAKTQRYLKEIFGENSKYIKEFSSLSWTKDGQYFIGGPTHIDESFNPQIGIERVNQEAYIEQLEIARGVLLAAKDEIEEAEEFNTPIDAQESKIQSFSIIDTESMTEAQLLGIIRRAENTHVPGSLFQKAKLELELRDRVNKSASPAPVYNQTVNGGVANFGNVDGPLVGRDVIQNLPSKDIDKIPFWRSWWMLYIIYPIVTIVVGGLLVFMLTPTRQ